MGGISGNGAPVQELHFQCIFVYVSPQTFADVEAVRSSAQLLEESNSEPDYISPLSNPASANTATNSESVDHNTDLQVCLSYVSLSFSVLKNIFCPVIVAPHWP